LSSTAKNLKSDHKPKMDESGDNILVLTGRSITEKEFRSFQELVFESAGIFLSEAKRALLVGRLNKRLRELNIISYGEYYDYVIKDKSGLEKIRMLDCICTNETQFFREPQHFEYIAQTLLPMWEAEAEEGQREKKIRAWSAACSTGEEPYSLAMTLLSYFPASSGWKIEVFASDLSTKALDVAKAGIWPIEKKTSIPDNFLKEFMLKGSRSWDGKMAACKRLTSAIKFARLNLNDENYPITGKFDLIFCRNVLIYFNQQSKDRVINRLLSRMAPDGHLFLGHAESLQNGDLPINRVIPNVYTITD
jgi:chemotaxis protein methyltransferase CheR